MVGSLLINVLVYTHNDVSPVTSSIFLKTSIGNSHKKLFEVHTPSSGSPNIFPVFYTTNVDLEVDNF